MENNQRTCPVCGAIRQNNLSFSCGECGCPGAYYTLFSGESAFELWKANIQRHKKEIGTRLYLDSRDLGSSLLVTSDRVCFHNGKTNEAVMCGFNDDSPVQISNTKQVSLSGLYHVWLNVDGTVSSSGDDESGQRRLADITNAVSVTAAPNCTYVVRADGTVIDRGICPFDGQPAAWTDIRHVAANQLNIVGLKSDGTVVHAQAHNSPLKDYAAAIDGWKDVQTVSVGDQYVLALHKNGTVSYAGPQDERAAAAGWTNVVAIAADGQYAVGLTAEGDVLLAGKESPFIDFGRKQAKQWKNMAFIAAGRSVIAGLSTDGELKVVGNVFKSDSFENCFTNAVYASIGK